MCSSQSTCIEKFLIPLFLCSPMHPLQQAYSAKKQVITDRLTSFSRLSSDDLFYEFCFCLLTPQSKGKFCWEKVQKLRSLHFKESSFNPHRYIKDMRFHHHKNKYLLAGKQIYPQVLEQLSLCQDSSTLRAWLAKNVDGYGYKESSHFLRNIGHTNLAILDRHILKNLVHHKVIPELPKTLTPKTYLAIEQRFQRFAQKINIPMDALDLLFWSTETGEVFK